MDKLSEKCRQRMEDLHLSIRGVANAQGLPEASVRNFVKGDTKNPSAELVGQICAALGISLDEHFSIPVPRPNKDNEKRLIHSLNEEAMTLQKVCAEKDKLIEAQESRIKGLRLLSAALVVLCLLLAVSLAV